MNVKKGLFSDDFVFFNQQLVNLLKTNLPIVPGLRHLAKDIKKKNLSSVINSIATDIESGKTITESFSRYPDLFPSVYIAMIKAGESSGRLPEILQDLVIYSEKMNKLQKKIKEVMIYPAILLVAGIILGCFIVVNFVPSFLEFRDFLPSGRIPKFFTFLVFLYNHWIKVLIAIILIVGIFFIAKHFIKRKMSISLEKFSFRLPLYGKILRYASLSRFARNLAMLLSSHISLPDALCMSGPSSGSVQINSASDEMQRWVSGGKRWTDILFNYPIFPHIFAWTISVSEKKGDLEEGLFYLADFYDHEFDRQIDIFIHFIEPIIILCIGLLVAVVAILAVRAGISGILGVMYS